MLLCSFFIFVAFFLAFFSFYLLSILRSFFFTLLEFTWVRFLLSCVCVWFSRMYGKTKQYEIQVEWINIETKKRKWKETEHLLVRLSSLLFSFNSICWLIGWFVASSNASPMAHYQRFGFCVRNFFFWSFLCWATTTLWWQSTHTYCHSFLRQHSYIWNSVYRFLLIKMANGNKIHRTILQLNEPQNNEHWIISGQLLLFSSGTAVIFAVDLLWQRQPTTTTTTTNLVEMWSCVMDFLFIYPFPCWYRCVTIHLVFIYCLHTWCYMLCWNMILSEN